ncbi:MAG: hypothetical protein GX593_11715 [Actinomycetales bacterium]|nr:hypothetical protein [Actinomycetales bacterium]
MSEIDVELNRINREPYGTARSLAAEQLVRQVEAEGPHESRAYAYSTLVDSLVWGGEVEKAFVPFTRWVRWYDEHPEHFDGTDRYHLFWSFKWMVTHVSDYPHVPFEQIEATLSDMERRYALAGHGMNGVRLEQFRWAHFRGAPDTDRAYREWTTTPRDEFSNCEACDPSERALYLASTGEVAEAVRLLEVTLANDPSCGSEPEDMLSQLAMGYLELGRPVEAASAYRRASAKLGGSVGDMASTIGRLVLFLARGGQAERAVRRIEESQQLLVEADTPRGRLQFLTTVAGAMRLVAASDPALPVRLTDVPAATAAELAAWSEAQARELAAAFDVRNRTDALTRQLDKVLDLPPVPAPIDLNVIPRTTTEEPVSVAQPEVAATGRDGQQIIAEADRLVQREDIAGAAALYLEAVAVFRAAGALEDAGLAEANAARCAHLLEDVEGADDAYRHAVAVLRASGTDVVLVSAVARARLAVAVETGTASEALDELADLRAQLAARIEAEDSPRLRIEHAESLDSNARALAAAGVHLEAARLAGVAAERFAALGRVKDAAHAFWLAGRSFVADGQDSEAVYHLESAVEGFGMARERELRGRAATDLVEALRRLGRDADADAAARGLD